MFLNFPNHNATDDKERFRIYSKKGEIRESPFDFTSKIYCRGRMYPDLSITRSLGDLLAHQIGVISEPSIKVHNILANDKYIVMASSSLWRLMLPDQVIMAIADLGVKDKGVFCDTLFAFMKESAQNADKAIDDTTIIISHLN